jgi:hypothetical protein
MQCGKIELVMRLRKNDAVWENRISDAVTVQTWNSRSKSKSSIFNFQYQEGANEVFGVRIPPFVPDMDRNGENSNTIHLQLFEVGLGKPDVIRAKAAARYEK